MVFGVILLEFMAGIKTPNAFLSCRTFFDTTTTHLRCTRYRRKTGEVELAAVVFAVVGRPVVLLLLALPSVSPKTQSRGCTEAAGAADASLLSLLALEPTSPAAGT